MLSLFCFSKKCLAVGFVPFFGIEYLDVLPYHLALLFRLASDWKPTMQIVRLISSDYMNNKYVSDLCYPPMKSLYFPPITIGFYCWSWWPFSLSGLFVDDIRQYLGKCDYLVFRVLNQHGFLSQLQEKKLVSNETILLSFAIRIVLVTEDLN